MAVIKSGRKVKKNPARILIDLERGGEVGITRKSEEGRRIGDDRVTREKEGIVSEGSRHRSTDWT